jgi:Sec-independent protein secretion pathway component TatC
MEYWQGNIYGVWRLIVYKGVYIKNMKNIYEFFNIIMIMPKGNEILSNRKIMCMHMIYFVYNVIIVNVYIGICIISPNIIYQIRRIKQ